MTTATKIGRRGQEPVTETMAMRVSKEKVAENHERILDEAARLFRERGLSGVGVDALTEAAGLTYGSLYSHFGSKEALMAEAVTRAFAGFGIKMSATKSAAAFVEQYLSAEHRDGPGDGCAVAALGCEMSRQSKTVRRAFTEGAKGAMARLGARLPDEPSREREDKAWAMIATLMGAIVLARAVDDPALSDRILSAARTRLGAAA